MCTICKIKNVQLVEEIERRLNTNAGSLTDKDKKDVKDKNGSSGGFVSYILLGVITFVVSIVLLYLFIK